MEKHMVLVTGCSTGIGRATVEALRAAGYRVIASARRSIDVADLENAGFEAVKLDLADPSSIEEAVKSMNGRFGGVPNIVVHNAGFGMYGALEDLSRSALRAQFEANVFGVHQLNTLLIPSMRERGHGRIIIVTSILGFIALPFRGAYAASKFALEAMADTLRLELNGTGVKVSLIEPGPIETAFRRSALEAFMSNVDLARSAHLRRYKSFLAGLAAIKSTKSFVLPAEACVGPIRHAMESRHPRARYRVTLPTKIFAVLKRLLPTAVLDHVLARG